MNGSSFLILMLLVDHATASTNKRGQRKSLSARLISHCKVFKSEGSEILLLGL